MTRPPPQRTKSMTDHTSDRKSMQRIEWRQRDGERRRRERLREVWKGTAENPDLAPVGPPLNAADSIERCEEREVDFLSVHSGPTRFAPWCGQIACPVCCDRSCGQFAWMDCRDDCSKHDLAVRHLCHVEGLLYRHGPTAWVVRCEIKRATVISRKLRALRGTRVFLPLADSPGYMLIITSHRIVLNANKVTRREGDLPMIEMPVADAVIEMAQTIRRGLAESPRYRKGQALVTPRTKSDKAYVGDDLADQKKIFRDDTRHAWWWTCRWFESNLLPRLQFTSEKVEPVYSYFLGLHDSWPDAREFGNHLVPDSRSSARGTKIRHQMVAKDATPGF